MKVQVEARDVGKRFRILAVVFVLVMRGMVCQLMMRDGGRAIQADQVADSICRVGVTVTIQLLDRDIVRTGRFIRAARARGKRRAIVLGERALVVRDVYLGNIARPGLPIP